MKTDALTAIPPAGVTITTLWGYPLQEWVYALTIIYTLFLIIDKLPNIVGRFRVWARKLKNYVKGD
jgi:hypothetical protein